MGPTKKAVKGHFTGACSDRTGLETERIFKLNIRKKFFSVKVVRCWDKLPRKVVDA